MKQANIRLSVFGYQVRGGLYNRLSERIGAFVEAKFDSGTATEEVHAGLPLYQARTPVDASRLLPNA